MAKILIVEDESLIVRILKANLTLAGYEVVTACDGAEGLRKVKEERPDLVILDDLMPVMTGFEVLERLRMDKQTAHLPIILFGVSLWEEYVWNEYHGSPHNYRLPKPFEPEELLSLIKHILTLNEDNPDTGATTHQTM